MLLGLEISLKVLCSLNRGFLRTALKNYQPSASCFNKKHFLYLILLTEWKNIHRRMRLPQTVWLPHLPYLLLHWFLWIFGRDFNHVTVSQAGIQTPFFWPFFRSLCRSSPGSRISNAFFSYVKILSKERKITVKQAQYIVNDSYLHNL